MTFSAGFLRSMVQVLVVWFWRLMEPVETATVGVVVSYDRETRLASVRPQVKRRYRDELDAPVDESQPIIDNVPVMFPGNNQFEVVWDVHEGDDCVIVYSKDSLEDWLETGAESAATELKPFDITNAIAYVGVRPKSKARDAVPANGMRVGAVDGPRLTFDMDKLMLQLTALNEIQIVAGSRIVIQAPDLFLNGHWVDPTTESDLG